MPPVFAARVARRLTAGLAVALSLALGACKDFTAINASFANVTDSDTVFALNGSPPNASTAIRFFDGTVSRADQGFGYDIAFDIDDQGRAVILPVRAVATNFSNPYHVGLQVTSTPFEQILSAPKEGYRLDTAAVVGPGQTVIVESHDANICLYAVKGGSYFSKVLISNVDVENRRIAITVTVNRNCGFRSFEPGIPRN